MIKIIKIKRFTIIYIRNDNNDKNKKYFRIKIISLIPA